MATNSQIPHGYLHFHTFIDFEKQIFYKMSLPTVLELTQPFDCKLLDQCAAQWSAKIDAKHL